MDLHPLLARQLRRLHLDADAGPPAAEAWAALLARVSQAYKDADQDRYLLERSQDISSRELNEQARALRVSEARMASLLSLSSDWVWEQNESLAFTFHSEGFRASTGLDPKDWIGRSRPNVELMDASDEDRARYKACIEARTPFRDIVYALPLGDGRKRFVCISGQPIIDDSGSFRGYRGVGSDVTAATLAKRQIEQMARYDGLTGLPNRSLLRESLERALARAARDKSRVALCFIDLDGFKYINDNLGHAAGDELLKTMASRLSGLVRLGDLVARLGGDEFVVLIERAADRATLATLAGRILEMINKPVQLEGREFTLTASVGISVYPEDSQDLATLLRNADAAMYVAKDQGKANYHFYTSDLAAQAAERFALEAELRQTIEHHGLSLHYQPKYRIAGSALTGMEALVRWQHPQRGLLMPAAFIGLAEERGLIVPIGRCVIEAACRQLRAWTDAGLDAPRCAINLSAHHFATDTLVAEIGDALRRWGLGAHALEIEITESAVMADPERADRIMHGLHAMGVKIAIDDFGTGYSSLAYLKRFPAQSLKIDRSFVRGLPRDLDDCAITQAVVAMAHSLGIGVVAEGVESVEQLAFLRALGCDEAQGYLLGRPMPAEAFGRLLQPLPEPAAGA